MGFASSNPAAHPSVKRYLTSVREEQAKARVTARQAVPRMFADDTHLTFSGVDIRDIDQSLNQDLENSQQTN